MTARALVLLAILAQPAHGQDKPAEPPPPAPEGEVPPENEIIVTAPQERGTVIGRSVPDVRLGGRRSPLTAPATSAKSWPLCARRPARLRSSWSTAGASPA